MSNGIVDTLISEFNKQDESPIIEKEPELYDILDSKTWQEYHKGPFLEKGDIIEDVESITSRFTEDMSPSSKKLKLAQLFKSKGYDIKDISELRNVKAVRDLITLKPHQYSEGFGEETSTKQFFADSAMEYLDKMDKGVDTGLSTMTTGALGLNATNVTGGYIKAGLFDDMKLKDYISFEMSD